MQTLNLLAPDGSTTQTLHVPTSWADVSLARYIALCQQPDRPAVLTLTDLSAEQFAQLAASDAVYLNFLTQFTQDEQALLSLPAVEVVNIGAAPYGQLLLVQQFIEQYQDEPAIYHAPWIYAVYESHKRYGQSNSAEQMQRLYDELLSQPMTQAFPICAAFLVAWRISTSDTRPTPTTAPSPTTTNTKRGWRSWASVLRTSSPSTN